MSKFYIAPAKFESKSIVASNALIFHRTLTDSAKLLILAMHAILSCTHTWVIIQSDLQKRMGWGKEKMRGAIKNAEEHGFIKRRQGRRKELKDEDGNLVKGQYAANEFDFDVTGNLLNNSMQEIDPSSGSPDKIEPCRENPHTAKGCTAKQPLPITRSLPIPRKQQQAAPLAAVSSSLEKIELPLKEKAWLTENYSDETICNAVAFATHPLTKIKTSLLKTIKWACKERPPIPINEAAEALKKKEEERTRVLENKQLSEDLSKSYYSKTKDAYAVRAAADYIELDLNGSGKSLKVYYKDSRFRDLVGHELKKKGFIKDKQIL